MSTLNYVYYRIVSSSALFTQLCLPVLRSLTPHATLVSGRPHNIPICAGDGFCSSVAFITIPLTLPFFSAFYIQIQRNLG